MSALDRRLLAAHAAGDRGALVTLYREAAAGVGEGPGADEARAFYLTHAWVFALEAGDARAEALGRALAAMGRA